MLSTRMSRPGHSGKSRVNEWVIKFNSLRPSDEYMRQWTNHHWFRSWLVAWPAPSHDLNQCWDSVNWTLGNKIQWHINRNSYIFIQENAFENVVWKIAAILSRPQCVNGLFGDSGHHGPCSPYKPCSRSLYVGIIFFPYIDSTQSAGHN